MGGYICLGIGFGVLLQKAGYGPLWAFVMSLTIYGGTMQYVGAALIASGADFLTAIITTLAVSARQLFYAVSMLPIYKGAGWKTSNGTGSKTAAFPQHGASTASTK